MLGVTGAPKPRHQKSPGRPKTQCLRGSPVWVSTMLKIAEIANAQTLKSP